MTREEALTILAIHKLPVPSNLSTDKMLLWVESKAKAHTELKDLINHHYDLKA